MKKSILLIALALGTGSVTFAQNVGINTDGSDPDSDAILHVKDNNTDSSVVRVENEQATLTKFELRNTSAKWDLRIPTGKTDLRINNGSGQDHVTIQNDGDVGIGTTLPVSTLDINGSVGYAVITITSATTLTDDHHVILCNNGPYTVTLPSAAASTGRVYYIKNIDTDGDDITVDGNGVETIDDSGTYNLNCEKDVISIISDGSNWFIIDKDMNTCVQPPTASAGAALSAICQGETSAAMGGSVGGSATGGTWTGGAGTWTNANDPSTATYTADASESGNITLTLTTSGGSFGTTTATKNITVNATNTAGTASSTPTLEVNTALTAITHATSDATGIGTVTGLPAGVTAAWASDMITISGTPTEVGTFAYNIALTGGCGSVNATGTITVEAAFTCGDDVTFTYNGASVTYGTLSSSVNGGPCWMNRNLGASKVAVNSTDYLAYGDLFQWGRAAEGHQLITWASSTTSSWRSPEHDASRPNTASQSGAWDGKFIDTFSDWVSPRDDDGWKEDGTGVNNPCPSGWRVPTESEWLAESSASAPGFSKYGHLKLPMAGRRFYSTGSLYYVGSIGHYWSSTVSGTNASYLTFNSSNATMYTYYRAYGYSVRCLKD